MAITPELLDTVFKALSDGNAQRPGVDRELREAFPGVLFTVCDDNDIPSRVSPLLKGEDFALYGVNASEHCASLTPHIENATGLTIALINDED